MTCHGLLPVLTSAFGRGDYLRKAAYGVQSEPPVLLGNCRAAAEESAHDRAFRSWSDFSRPCWHVLGAMRSGWAGQHSWRWGAAVWKNKGESALLQVLACLALLDWSLPCCKIFCLQQQQQKQALPHACTQTTLNSALHEADAGASTCPGSFFCSEVAGAMIFCISAMPRSRAFQELSSTIPCR